MKKIAVIVFTSFMILGGTLMTIQPSIDNLQAHRGYHHNDKGYHYNDRGYYQG